uniref:Enoyl reductase (ER) domain-containing protein n=1 Tax=Clastoptera arizonana TaxID=38151 RepID=A0A1B6E8X3_9HEMI
MKTTNSIFMKYESSGCSPSFVLSKEELLPDLDKFGVLVEIKACGLSLPLCDGINLCGVIRRVGRNRLPAGQDISGVVRGIGSDVITFKVGDEVTGIIPIDYEQSGCAGYVVVQEFDLAIKHNNVTFVDAAGCIGECVRSYLALHYLGHLVSGDTVLVINGASAFGSICIQLAHHWGAKVMTTCTTSDEKLYLQTLGQKIAHVIDMGDKSMLRATCMKATSNLGVNLVIDQRKSFCPQSFRNISDIDSNINKDEDFSSPSSHDIISCLAVGSHWITTNANLQLDPPHSRQLSMRCASIGFLFEQAWLLGSTQQGKYQHILMDVVEKLSTRTIRPNIHHTIGPDALLEAWQELGEVTVGKVVLTN